MAADVEEGAAVASIVASSHGTLQQTRIATMGKASSMHLSEFGTSVARLVNHSHFLPQ